MRHFLGIDGMERAALEALLDRAQLHQNDPSHGAQALRGKVVANLFFENSTRTRTSFEMAAKALGASVLNWSVQGSSHAKGESLLDTARNIEAMGVHAMVIRHAASGAAHLVSQAVRCAVINAGDGLHEHPSQALLDAFTLRRRWKSFEGRTVLIVGDILHSRVARSNLFCLRALGAKVLLCAPPTLLPAGFAALADEVGWDLDALLPKADAVMCLRLQAERQNEALFPSTRDFAKHFGLNAARAEKLRPEVLVMHPGPINRGVELASAVADGPRSVILDQVAHGVAVRRALLEVCT